MAIEANGPSYWIIVGSVDNFRRTRDIGFTVQGMKSRHRKKVERMRPGDRIVYYLTGVKAFAAVSTITSGLFESRERIWVSGDPKKETEEYPFRVLTNSDFVLDADEAVPAEPIAREMEYVAKWPADNWTLAFQGNVHQIGESDFRRIEAAIKACTPVGATIDAR